MSKIHSSLELFGHQDSLHGPAVCVSRFTPRAAVLLPRFTLPFRCSYKTVHSTARCSLSKVHSTSRRSRSAVHSIAQCSYLTVHSYAKMFPLCGSLMRADVHRRRFIREFRCSPIMIHSTVFAVLLARFIQWRRCHAIPIHS